MVYEPNRFFGFQTNTSDEQVCSTGGWKGKFILYNILYFACGLTVTVL